MNWLHDANERDLQAEIYKNNCGTYGYPHRESSCSSDGWSIKYGWKDLWHVFTYYQ